jgi:4'-phosphopantetheinyl transferase EntD
VQITHYERPLTAEQVEALRARAQRRPLYTDAVGAGPAERAELAALPREPHWDRILFCAKEATYKAWFPLTRRWLGFEDAHISFTLTGEASGTFVSRILIDPAALAGPPLTELRGRWSVTNGLVLTAIVL